MSDYEIHYFDDPVYPIPCDNCGAGENVPGVPTVRAELPGRVATYYCEVCYETGLHKAHAYPHQFEDPDLYRCIARAVWLLRRDVARIRGEETGT